MLRLPSKPLDTLLTRRSLLTRLKRWDDQEGWTTFFDTYWSLIYSSALKMGLAEDEAEDVVQDTVIAVSKAMPAFKYDPDRGTFRAWLLKITSCRIRDRIRRRPNELLVQSLVNPNDEDESSDPILNAQAPLPELEGDWDNDWESALLNAALERVKQRADPRYYQIFELYVLEEWSVQRICSFLNIGPARVYLARHRIRSVLKKELKTLKKTWQ